MKNEKLMLYLIDFLIFSVLILANQYIVGAIIFVVFALIIRDKTKEKESN